MPSISQLVVFLFPSIVFSIESNTIVPFPQSWPTFSQIATSVTERPLPPTMREFKPTKLQLSILRLHLSILFFGDGRSRFISSTFNFASSSAHHPLMNSELL
ncbi:hypothetical protein AVEN_84602-1 [Araneus ventricosus]|uniref:Secreted protein n=1 Tax=Araneus ventricosus TaxID=182803 RepID=A0A4Y2C3A2_ARAVE|nr:hypothetical protein AVEN_84602-1 [Araneus ventricosus]